MCTNVTKLDKCNKVYKMYNMYKMQILRVAQDDRAGVLHQDRWWSHTACFDPRLFSVMPGLIWDPVSWLCPAGFRPRATRGGGLWGFAPTRRGPFVSAKGPKTIGARAWPPRGGACAPVPVTWAAELAALRQSSPPYGMDGTGAQPRPQAPGGVSCYPRLRSGIQGLGFVLRGFAPARRGDGDCGVSPPHDEVLLFRQKDPKPVAPGRGPARRHREVAPAFLVMRNNGTGFPVKLAALCCHCGFGHHLAVGADFRGRRLPADGAGAEVLTILFGNLAGCFMLFGLTIQKGQIEGMLGSR